MLSRRKKLKEKSTTTINIDNEELNQDSNQNLQKQDLNRNFQKQKTKSKIRKSKIKKSKLLLTTTIETNQDNNKTRNKLLLSSLPKNIFQINGSQTLWNDIIGYDNNTEEDRKKFFNLINNDNIDYMKKYFIAKLLIDNNNNNNLEWLLKNWNNEILSIENDENYLKFVKTQKQQQMNQSNKRLFNDCGTQTKF